MALPINKKKQLRDALRQFGAAYGPTAIPNGAGKALEAWVMFKLAQAAAAKPGWTVELRCGDGSALSPGAVFKFGKGRIPASHASAASYISLELAGSPLIGMELRGSIQWRGRSEALHECDISMVPATVSSALRAQPNGGFPRGLPLLLVECKDKGREKGNLDETRQTLARLYDLALVTQPYPNAVCRCYEEHGPTLWGSRSTKYVRLFKRGTFAIARAGRFQSGTKQLAEHYSIKRLPLIYRASGLSLTALRGSFVDTLDALSTY